MPYRYHVLLAISPKYICIPVVVNSPLCVHSTEKRLHSLHNQNLKTTDTPSNILLMIENMCGKEGFFWCGTRWSSFFDPRDLMLQFKIHILIPVICSSCTTPENLITRPKQFSACGDFFPGNRAWFYKFKVSL